MISDVKKEIKKLANPVQAKLLLKFFKTAVGEYGEGDIFLGIKVPEERKVAKRFWKEINLEETQELLKSKIHEERFISLLILIEKYREGNEREREKIFSTYINSTKWINNWDLVDVTCPKIVGDYLLDKKRDVLYEFARSENLWKKRISIISTFAFIKKGEFEDTINIAKILLKDKHDLIHKAVGWALREVGKKKEKLLIDFLEKHYKEMPRTMVRYSIEKLDEKRRKDYLKR